MSRTPTRPVSEGPPRLQVALVGCGRIARMFHLPILRDALGADLVTVVDPDPGARAAAAAAAPGVLAVGTVDELLAGDAPPTDAVVVCTPTHLHAEAAVAAFDAGRHVWVEKPLAADLPDARRIHAAWRRSGRVGAVGFVFRHHPLVRRTRLLVRGGELGHVTAIRTVFSSSPRDLPAWKRDRRTGGGALLDLASHHVDLVRFVLGEEVVEVAAAATSVRHDLDTVALQLRTASGLPVQVTATQSAAQSDRVEVLGDRATVVLDRMARRRLTVVPAAAPSTPVQRARAAVRAVRDGVGVTVDGLRPPVEASFEAALHGFVADARRGHLAGASVEDGWRTALILDAAARSLDAGGRPVAVPPADGAAGTEGATPTP